MTRLELEQLVCKTLDCVSYRIGLQYEGKKRIMDIMKTITLTNDQLCNIISLAVMCARDVNYQNADYVKRHLAINGIDDDALDDIFEHFVSCIVFDI